MLSKAKEQALKRLEELKAALEQSAGQHNLLVGRKTEVEYLITLLEENEQETPPVLEVPQEQPAE